MIEAITHKQVNEKKCMYNTVGQAAWDFVNTWSILKINRLIWNKVNVKLLNSNNFFVIMLLLYFGSTS